MKQMQWVRPTRSLDEVRSAALLFARVWVRRSDHSIGGCVGASCEKVCLCADLVVRFFEQ